MSVCHDGCRDRPGTCPGLPVRVALRLRPPCGEASGVWQLQHPSIYICFTFWGVSSECHNTTNESVSSRHRQATHAKGTAAPLFRALPLDVPAARCNAAGSLRLWRYTGLPPSLAAAWTACSTRGGTSLLQLPVVLPGLPRSPSSGCHPSTLLAGGLLLPQHAGPSSALRICNTASCIASSDFTDRSPKALVAHTHTGRALRTLQGRQGATAVPSHG